MRDCTFEELFVRLGGDLRGPAPSGRAGDVAPLEEALEKDLTIYVDARLREQLRRTRALAAVTDEEHSAEVVSAGLTAWVHQDPWEAIALVADALRPLPDDSPLVHEAVSGSWVAESAVVGHGVVLSPACIVRGGARIGAGTTLGPCAIIERGSRMGIDCRVGAGAWIGPGTRMGDRVEIGEGAIVGSDGFGLRWQRGAWVPIRHVGIVEIGDDAALGARSVVARGTLGATSIGPGTRIDAQVQVGHNVRIGARCAISAQAGIAGSSVIGNDVLVGGQAGIADHVTVGDGARIGAQAGVVMDVPAGAVCDGTPAVDRWRWLRMMSWLRRSVEPGDGSQSGETHEKE